MKSLEQIIQSYLICQLSLKALISVETWAVCSDNVFKLVERKTETHIQVAFALDIYAS